MDDLTFVVRAAVKDQQLVAGYRVTNQSRRDVYLLNRLYRSTPAWSVSGDIAFVEFDRPASLVSVSKRIPTLPAGMTPTHPYKPFVTPVRSRQSFSEVIRLPLPLIEFKQFGNTPPADDREPEEIMLRGLTLQIQYYWRPEGTEEVMVPVQGNIELMPRTPHGKNPELNVLQSAVLAVTAPGLVPPQPA